MFKSIFSNAFLAHYSFAQTSSVSGIFKDGPAMNGS